MDLFLSPLEIDSSITGIRSPIKICAASPFSAIMEGVAITTAFPDVSKRLSSGLTKNL